MFDAGTPNVTPVHGFPLPPENRQYTPQYRRGQYVLNHPITGKPNDTFTRVTTAVHALESQDGLDQWKMSNVVLGLKQKPELLDNVDLFDEPINVRRAVRSVARDASDVAGAQESAERGTAIHAWTEAVERDGLALDQVPREFHPYVARYLSTLREWGILSPPEFVERIVFNATTGWVGTLDRIWQLADETLVIGDIKTSKTMKYSYLGFAAQLACYATSTHMLSLDGSTWEPMSEVRTDIAVIAHLPSDKPGHCELIPFDLTVGIEVLGLIMRVDEFRRRAEDFTRSDIPLPPPGLMRKIDMVTSPEELSALWESHQRGWTDAHTQAGVNKLTSLGYRLQG